ncbi:MAG: hypothetical protein ACK5IJ_06725, partial [Mangrovibacterium sp.]
QQAGVINAFSNVTVYGGSVSEDITSTKGSVTVQQQKAGVIKAYSNLTVYGDAGGSLVLTSTDASVTVSGSNNGEIYCPSGNVTIYGSNNGTVYVGIGKSGNVKVSGKRGTIVEKE